MRRRTPHERVMIPIPRPVGTAIFLAAWLMPWRPAFRTRAGDSGLVFYVHWRDLIGRHIAKYGVHEPVLTKWIGDYLADTPARGLFIDVGANLGWHAAHAAQYEAVETVVAFEPDSFNCWLLDRNLAANGIDNTVVVASAVGARRGVTRMYRYRGTNFGRHSLLTDYGYGSRLVPMTDLDASLEALGLADRPVLILKIDVEGYEPAVIEGAARVLERTAVVLLEYSPDLGREGGLSAQAMVEQLYDAGFVPYRFGEGNRVTEIARADLRGFAGQMDLVWISARGGGQAA
jgi:FkbM family methyltransferase